MDVWCILPNLINYGKSYVLFWGVGWVSYAIKWAYGSIFGAYVKWNA